MTDELFDELMLDWLPSDVRASGLEAGNPLFIPSSTGFLSADRADTADRTAAPRRPGSATRRATCGIMKPREAVRR